jgi:hypothetical protein
MTLPTKVILLLCEDRSLSRFAISSTWWPPVAVPKQLGIAAT